MISTSIRDVTRVRALGVALIASVLIMTGCGSQMSEKDLKSAEGQPAANQEAPPSTEAPSGGVASLVPSGSSEAGDSSQPAATTPAGSSEGGSKQPAAALSRSAGPAATPAGAGSVGAGGTNAPGSKPNTAAAPGASGSASEKKEPAPGNVPPGLGGGTGSCAGQKSKLILGSFGHGSGPLGAVFRAPIVAAKAWVADVNARGGLNCHPVELRFADDHADPNQALAIVRRMVEEDHILAIYNQVAPLTIDAVAPYLESKGIPFLGSVPGNQAFDNSPMSFQPSTSDRGTGWSHILPLLQFPGPHKIATLFCREAAGCKSYNEMVEKFAPQIDSKVVFSAQVSLAQPDYTAEVLAARNAGADALVTIVENASTVRIARSAHQQGWNPIVTVQHTGDSQSLLQNPDAEGVATDSSTVEWSAAAEMKPYRDAVARYQPGGELGGFGAAAWAAGKLLEAASRNLSDNPTSAELIASLLALRGETLGGIVPPVTFPKEGSRAGVNECVVIGVVKKGRLVTPGAPNQFACAPGWKPLG